MATRSSSSRSASQPRECGAPGVLAARVRAQLLAGPRPASAVAAVRRVGSLQAQDPRALRLALRVRTAAASLDLVEADLARDLVVTWLMRGTLHVVPVEDVRWSLALLRPSRSAGRTRRAALGLDDQRLDRLLAELSGILADGPLTRAEIAAAVGLGPGQAAPHLLAVGAREGLLCRGADRDGEPTYVRLEDRVPPAAPLPRDEALVRLASRYAAGHGPVDAADFAAWSGLPLRDARAGLAAAGPGAVPEGAGPDGTVRLVPAYDEYLLGYRDRPVDPAYARRIQPGGGVVSPAVLHGGRIVGRWSQRRQRDRVAVTVEAFGPMPAPVRDGIEEEVADLGRFLGVGAYLRALDHLSPD
jgi:winged helix DNA-binding protein